MEFHSVITMAEMIEVKATEFQNKFGRYRALAHHTPISVTSHGNADLVVISAREYKRLKARDRQALRAEQLSPEDIAALAAAEVPEESAAFNNELNET